MIVYGFFTKLHRFLYTSRILKPVKVNKTVLSVGNLSFGGTGKTPFVKELARELKSLGKKPALVVRSYKGSATGAALMDLEKSKHPEIWGDEACWYFQQVQAPVYSGPQKWKSAILAAENNDIDVVIVDDGFQHHKLIKDFNIILVDSVKGIRDLKFKSRDFVSALEAASAVVLTRYNLVSVAAIEALKSFLCFSGPLFLGTTQSSGIRTFNGEKISRTTEKLALVSGIANPESFLLLAQKMFPQVQIIEFKFPDHHFYSQKDLEEIAQHNIPLILTTEKDETKLKGFSSFDYSNWGVLEIETSLEKPEDFKKFLKGLSL